MTILASNESSFESTTMHDDFDVSIEVTIRSILISRAKNGATIEDIRNDYFEYTGEGFPIKDNIVDFLLNVRGVVCYKDINGTFIFDIASTDPKSQHILDMVRKQKPDQKTIRKEIPNRKRPPPRSESSSTGSLDNQCYFKDNYDYLHKSRRPRAHSASSSAHLYVYQLLGDDFLLSVARSELNCRYAPGHQVLQSGLCVSGQTIRDATERIRSAKKLSDHIIVNIGSVDILHGHDLMDIKHDFYKLMDVLARRNVVPIVTTLAPLANYYHRPYLKHNLERFNEFLGNNWEVVDLWPIMVNRNGHTLYECYQSEARYVTGSNQPHVLWNKIGRQRVLKCLKTQLL